MRAILIICFTYLFLQPAIGQVLSTSNGPSQVYSSTKSKIAEGPSVYGVFVGRTPCREFLRELKMEGSAACAKRKMSVTLYWDPVTHQPTQYETRGMGKWSGKGRWQIVKGTPLDPAGTVFELKFSADVSLFLLKGDDNVIFILDRNKNFLPGNADFSYTMNRARN